VSKQESEELHCLHHMLGISYRPMKTWMKRNYFCAGEKDVATMERLMSKGLVRERKNTLSPDRLFHATNEGKVFAIENSPPEPMPGILTVGQV
jgi:hypothetical protein